MENNGMNNFNHDYGKKIFIADIKRFCSDRIDVTVRTEAFLLEIPGKGFIELSRFGTYEDLYKIIKCSSTDDVNLDIYLKTSTTVEGGLYVDEETLLSYNAYVSKPLDMSNAEFRRLTYGKITNSKRKQAK